MKRLDDSERRTDGGLRAGEQKGRFVPARSIFAVMLIFISVHAVSAGGSGAFSLEPARELAIGIPALGLWTAGVLLDTPADPANDRRTDFGWFDEAVRFPYNRSIDLVADIGSLAGIGLLPFLLDDLSFESAATIGVMFAESALLLIGTKDMLKRAVLRPRPYANDTGAPESLRNAPEAYESFPSGHTAFAFMTASFSSYVFSKGDASDTTKTLFTVGSHALAGTVGALRVLGGSHYALDTAAGALLGSAIGLLVPLVHERQQSGAEGELVARASGFSASRDGVEYIYRF